MRDVQMRVRVPPCPPKVAEHRLGIITAYQLRTVSYRFEAQHPESVMAQQFSFGFSGDDIDDGVEAGSGAFKGAVHGEGGASTAVEEPVQVKARTHDVQELVGTHIFCTASNPSVDVSTVL